MTKLLLGTVDCIADNPHCCCCSCTPAGYGRLELVQLLLERGADLSARNKQKLRAVDAAKMNGEVRTALTNRASVCILCQAHRGSSIMPKC